MNLQCLHLLFESLNGAESPLYTNEESKRNDEVLIFLEFVTSDPLSSHIYIFFECVGPDGSTHL